MTPIRPSIKTITHGQIMLNVRLIFKVVPASPRRLGATPNAQSGHTQHNWVPLRYARQVAVAPAAARARCTFLEVCLGPFPPSAVGS